MKRLSALLLALLLVLACATTALADMGMPTIDPYLAVVRSGGVSATDFNDNPLSIPAGTVLFIFDEYENKFTAYYSKDGYYAQFSSADEVDNASDNGILVFGSNIAQIAPTSETVTPGSADKLTAPLKGKVKSSDGLILRSGPDTVYAVLDLLPDKTEVSYEYVTSTNGRDWAFTTYKGQDGWVCLDYVTAEQPSVQTQTATTTDLQSATATDLQPATPTSAATDTPEQKEQGQKQGRGLITTVLLALLFIVSLGLAAVILLRSLKKRQQALAGQEEVKAAEAADAGRPDGYDELDEAEELETLTEPTDRSAQ